MAWVIGQNQTDVVRADSGLAVGRVWRAPAPGQASVAGNGSHRSGASRKQLLAGRVIPKFDKDESGPVFLLEDEIVALPFYPFEFHSVGKRGFSADKRSLRSQVNFFSTVLSIATEISFKGYKRLLLPHFLRTTCF